MWDEKSLQVQSGVVDRLPNALCQLAKVTFIDVSANELKKLPGCLNKNEALVELRATNNKIKKPPPKLASAPNVAKVSLQHSTIEHF